MSNTIAALALLVLIGPMIGTGYAKGQQGRYIYDVIDGDGLAIVDREIDGKRDVVRILGLNAPEIRSAKCWGEKLAGYDAKARLQELLALYRVSVIYSGKHGKYGRPLVRVYVHNGMWGKRSVARILIKEKLARPYDGGKREGWC